MRAVSWTPDRRFVLLAAALTLAGCAPDRPVTPADTPHTPSGSGPDAPLPREFPLDEASQPVTVPARALASDPKPAPQTLPTREGVSRAFDGQAPKYWGLEAPGVLTRMPATSAGVSLTFDFCGGPDGNGADAALVAVLRQQQVPATLFLNARWIAANKGLAKDLAADPLFELANHGTSHRPLSVSGKTAYGIQGTRSPGEVYDEVIANDSVLTDLTGRRPRFFRPGTAYMDEVSSLIVRTMGLIPVGFSINGDAGATLPAQKVTNEISRARANDIVIAHGNHPAGGTAQGLTRALAIMKTRGEAFLPLP